ncbi:MAG: hypothetical protein ABWJ42_01155, partial [Sulfolobales archaeon]
GTGLSDKIRVVLYGLGPIGVLIARSLLKRDFYEIVGGVEIDPGKIGRDVGEVIGVEKIGAPVVRDLEAVDFLKRVKADVVVQSTGTYLDKIYPQIVKAVVAGSNVISTSETLVYPWYRYPELALMLDSLAKRYSVRILGTGVNPGFIFDTLPAVLSSVHAEINRISVVRSLDAGKRRYSFQKKYGLSLSPEEFMEGLKRGEYTAHVGYAESILLLGEMLGVKISRVEEGQEPVVADRYMETQYFKISPGRVAGVHGWGRGYVKDQLFITLDLYASVGREEYDEVYIEGEPSLRWRSSGVQGDIATAAMIVNMIPRMLKAQPGLITMKDLLTPSASLGRVE